MLVVILLKPSQYCPRGVQHLSSGYDIATMSIIENSSLGFPRNSPPQVESEMFQYLANIQIYDYFTPDMICGESKFLPFVTVGRTISLDLQQNENLPERVISIPREKFREMAHFGERYILKRIVWIPKTESEIKAHILKREPFKRYSL